MPFLHGEWIISRHSPEIWPISCQNPACQNPESPTAPMALPAVFKLPQILIPTLPDFTPLNFYFTLIFDLCSQHGWSSPPIVALRIGLL